MNIGFLIGVALVAHVSTTVVSDPAAVSLDDAGQVVIEGAPDAVTILETENTITVVYH